MAIVFYKQLWSDVELEVGPQQQLDPLQQFYVERGLNVNVEKKNHSVQLC
jgi:hypothetical protein